MTVPCAPPSDPAPPHPGLPRHAAAGPHPRAPRKRRSASLVSMAAAFLANRIVLRPILGRSPGMIDLEIEAEGDLHIDGHHTVEDVGITLGMAVAEAVGDKRGLTRYGHAYVPLDEALSRVVIDFSGRPGLVMNVPFKAGMIGGFDAQLTHEFFQGFANHALATCTHKPARENAHHSARRCQGVRARLGAVSSIRGGDTCLRRKAASRALGPGVKRTVAVVDYGMGNLRSVAQAVARVAREASKSGTVFEVVVTARPEEVAAAERVVLPGQGAMPDCMRELRDSGLEQAVRDAASSKPLLGVCVGMQMLLDRSEKAGGAGRRAWFDSGRSAPLPPGRPDAARRQPLQGAADGLERGAAGPPDTPSRPASGHSWVLLSCTASTPGRRSRATA